MICRRCGMESSTTDKCEWCKKPMLPPGGAISTKAKEELRRDKEAPSKPPENGNSPAPRETEEEAAIRRPESKPPPSRPEVHSSGLVTLGAHLADEPEEPGETPNYVAGGESKNEEILLPLGSGGTSGQGEEAKDTPIYIGNDENVLRPIERPVSKDGAKYTIDATGRKRRMVDSTPEIPEKVRLFRGAIHGGIVSVVMAILQFLVKHQVPDKVVVLAVGDSKSFLGALQFGVYSALLLGFMFSALLVQRKWGPVAGFFLGLPLGWTLVSMATERNMPWPLITGVLCGIVVGRASVKGLRRVVTV